MANVHTTDWALPANRERRALHPGKPQGLTRGAWVADLAALKKAIFLCWSCQPKFNARSNHYVRRNVCASHREAISNCDGCGAVMVKCALYKHEEYA